MAQVIIQLSDIHLSTNKPANPVCDKADRICGAIRSVLQPSDDCFLVFSGDIADWGKPEEYKLAQELLFDIVLQIEEHLGGVYPHVLMVPGNHDLDFDYHDSIRELVLNSVKSGKPIDEAQNEVCLQPQKPFRDFVAYLDDKLGIQAVTDLLDSKSYEATGCQFTFHLLNTAKFTRKKEIPGVSLFPFNLLAEHLESQRYNNHVNVAVLHHPYNWYEPVNASGLRSVLEANCDVILTGHEHTPDSFGKRRKTTEQNLYVEGGVLQDHEDKGSSSFNVIHVDYDARTFRCLKLQWCTDAYEQDGMGSEHKFIRLRQPLRNEFREQSEWTSWLEVIGTDFRHPRCQELRLSDIFIYPDFYKIDIRRGYSPIGTIDGKNILSYIQEKKRILITGAERTGKTCLAKRLFKDLRDAGFAPVLIRRNFSLEPNKSLQPGERIKAGISKTYEEIYQSPGPTRFWQTRIKERAIIIDDYHRLEIGVAGREQLLAWLDENFEIIVILGDSGLRIREIMGKEYGDQQLWGFEHVDILECGYKARFELISKWVAIGYDSLEETEDQLYQKAVRFDQIIDSLIYQNTIPSLPLFILMMLQQLEAKTAIDSSTGLYGHLFENIIKDWIHIISEDGPDLETKLNYLSEFAYSVVGNGQTSVSERDFEVWHENYCEVYNLSLSQRRLFDNLTEIGILTRTGDSIRFKYRYYLNFFVARYMALHIHEEDVIEHLEFCCKTLHHRDSTKTMIFLCHLSKDPIILKRVLETAKSHFADEEEYNLANMPSLLPPESFRPSRLILTGNTPEANRARMLEDADKAERPHGLEETDEIRERERELTDFVAQVNSAQNTMHLCGQILRNFYGSMKGEQQIDLIRTCFGIGLRTLSTIFRVLEDRKEELALGIAEILRHKHPRWNDATIDKRTRQSIQFLTMSITFGLVKQSSNAVGISRLKISFDKFLEAPGTMLSHQVIDLSARLDFFDQFPKSSVLTIADGLERNPFGMELLRLLVWQHFHLFNCQDNRLCQEICARLGINYHHGHFLSPVPKKSSRK